MAVSCIVGLYCNIGTSNNNFPFLYLFSLNVYCLASFQVLVQPQIIKTDSLVLTTLKTDGNPVMAAVQNPALAAITTPIQTTALQVSYIVGLHTLSPKWLLSSFYLLGFFLIEILQTACEHYSTYGIQ